MLFVLLSLVLGDTRVGNLPPYQWPADKFKSAAIGPSGTIAWRDDGSVKNAAVDCPGVDPTGMTYSDVGINACIQASAPSGDVNGGALFFPRGVYKLQNPINLTKRMIISGEGMTSTWFYPDPGVTGLIVRYACEGGPCIASRGDLSVIRDIGFEYALNASPWVGNQGVGLGYVAYGSTGPSNVSLTQVFQVTTAGTTASTEPTWGSASEGDFITDGTATWHAIAVACIRFNARATVRDVYCDRSSGNGILIEASTPFKNANSWNLDNVYVSQARLNGMYVQGADSNAGTAYGVHSGTNRLWGIYDNSFLGNTYTACSTEDNGFGAYYMGGINATNVLNGCYSEGGQPPTVLAGNSLSVGGLHGAGFSNNSGAFRMSGGNRFETSGGGITFRDYTAPSGAQISMPYASNYLINLTDDAEGSVGFSLQAGSGTGNAGWWRWRHANLDGRNFMSWGGTNADAPYTVWFPPGFYVGDRIFLDARTAKPTWTGTPENPGSFRYNTALYSQDTSGFTPGTFGWQNQGAGATPQIVTMRWPHVGFNNEKNLTANPSGTPYVIDWKDEAGRLYTNVGATGKQYVTLPASGFNPNISFIEFSAANDNANGIRMTATTHAIQYGTQSTSGGGYLESTTPGSYLKLKLDGHTGTNGAWNVVGIGGTWTDGTQTFTALGSLLTNVTAANRTITAGETGTTFTNAGASVTVTFTLPPAARGLRYHFAVDAAQALQVYNDTGDTITLDGVTFDANALPVLLSTTVGSTLDIEAQDSTKWLVTGRAGKWELDTFSSVELHRDVPPYETYLNPNAGKVLTIGATGELAWSTPSAATGSYVSKTGDTMTGPLVAASGITVATGNMTLGTSSALTVNSGLINMSNATIGTILVDNNSTYAFSVIDDLGAEFVKIDSTGTALMSIDAMDVAILNGHDLSCGGDLEVVGNTDLQGNLTIRDHGQMFFSNTTNGENIISLPTGQTEGLVINDASGQWYSHFDTSSKTFNFDVTSGYNGQVYFNQGNVFFNGAHLDNLMVLKDSDTDALDVKDTGGTYLMVANTVTKGFAMHSTTTNDAGADFYNGFHVQDFVYAPSGPTGSGTSFNTQTVLTRAFTAGDWMVRATLCTHDTIGGTNSYGLIGALSTTTNSLGSSVTGLTQNSTGLQDVSSATEACVVIGPTRISNASTTTYYAVLKWIQTVNHATQLYGGMEAWRPR